MSTQEQVVGEKRPAESLHMDDAAASASASASASGQAASLSLVRERADEEWNQLLIAQDELYNAGVAHIEACGKQTILSLPGFSPMQYEKIHQVFEFLLTTEPCLLAGGSYGAAGGVQGFKSTTGRVIQDKVQTETVILYVDILHLYVDKCRDFDNSGGPDLWKDERCLDKETFASLLIAATLK